MNTSTRSNCRRSLFGLLIFTLFVTPAYAGFWKFLGAIVASTAAVVVSGALGGPVVAGAVAGMAGSVQSEFVSVAAVIGQGGYADPQPSYGAAEPALTLEQQNIFIAAVYQPRQAPPGSSIELESLIEAANGVGAATNQITSSHLAGDSFGVGLGMIEMADHLELAAFWLSSLDPAEFDPSLLDITQADVDAFSAEILANGLQPVEREAFLSAGLSEADLQVITPAIAQQITLSGPTNLVAVFEEEAHSLRMIGQSILMPTSGFRRGDANNDGGFNIADGIFILSTLFVPGAPQPSCADAADTNDDGSYNIADAIAVLSVLFAGAPSPAAPGLLNCGPDPTEDTLDCEAFSCP